MTDTHTVLADAAVALQPVEQGLVVVGYVKTRGARFPEMGMAMASQMPFFGIKRYLVAVQETV
jgi:hypothetical protein